RTWLSAPLMLDRDKPEGARSTAPGLAIDPAGRLYAVWRTRLVNGNKEVQFTTSADHGATWTAVRALNEQGGAFSGRVAAPGDGHVYVVWYDERRTPGRPAPALRSQRGLMIFFNHSPDSGQTWLSHDLRLSEDQRPSALGAGT